MKTYSITLPDDLADLLEQASTRDHRSIENYIHVALDLHAYGAAKHLPPLADDETELYRRPVRSYMKASTRRVIFNRDGGVCQICRGDVEPDHAWHIDHIVPVSKGGTNDEANLQLTCAFCNLKKAAK